MRLLNIMSRTRMYTVKATSPHSSLDGSGGCVCANARNHSLYKDTAKYFRV